MRFREIVNAIRKKINRRFFRSLFRFRRQKLCIRVFDLVNGIPINSFIGLVSWVFHASKAFIRGISGLHQIFLSYRSFVTTLSSDINEFYNVSELVGKFIGRFNIGDGYVPIETDKFNTLVLFGLLVNQLHPTMSIRTPKTQYRLYRQLKDRSVRRKDRYEKLVAEQICEKKLVLFIKKYSSERNLKNK